MEGDTMIPPKSVWVSDATGKRYAGKVNDRAFRNWVKRAIERSRQEI